MGRPIDKPTIADTLESVDYKKALADNRKKINAHWDGANESIIDSKRGWKQIRPLLEAHMVKVLGKKFTIGRFKEEDIGSREALGYVVLTEGFFPRDGENKETWTPSIARSMSLQNHSDGTIRWGSRNELLICIIPSDLRESIQQQERDNPNSLMKRHLGKGERVTYDKHGREISMEDVEFKKERSLPLKRKTG